MNNRDILNSIKNSDDRLLVSRVLDKVEKAEKTNSIQHTDFLDPYQQTVLGRVFERIDQIEFNFTGGYEGAERVIAIFSPAFYFEKDILSDLPLKCLDIKKSGREAASHRDYLGALMGLGIKREKIGDILVGDDFCNVVVMSEIADYIALNLNSAGNSRVCADIISMENMIFPIKKTKEINTTVASMRLDSIVGSGYGVSRAKAAELIKAERVSLNWVTADSPAKPVKEGDTVSLKGRGRVIVEKVGGLTRKGRTSIILKQMI